MSEKQSKSPRVAPLLPPDSGRDRPLFAVAAILVFLACLSAFGAAGAWRAADGWTDQLTAEITVQILPGDGRDADADAVAAAEAIARLPGVTGVTALDRAEAERLVSPWLGSADLPEDLPIPRLVAVQIDAEAPPATGAIEALLSDEPYEILVDDHQRWEDAVQRAANAVRYFALGLVLLLTVAAAAVVAFAARASLAARWDVAEALHLVGAPDRYVTGLFQERFFFLGLKSGLAGSVAAALAALGLAQAGAASGGLFFVPTLELGWSALLIPPLAALIAALIAALAARSAVSSDLKARWI
ncbi:cell division protein FtsX [Oceanicaulis sp.]|jgi:cell division transport system permease protein|uniref:cell division protein FtsX n=1 Tax=Oceanicaulis sp. TaxID=1924941 RepID=UPI003F708F51